MAVMTGIDHTGEEQWEFSEHDFYDVEDDLDLLSHHASMIKDIGEKLRGVEKGFDRCEPRCPEFEEHWSDFVEAIFSARKSVDEAVNVMSASIADARLSPSENAKDRIREEWMAGERFDVEGE